MDGRIEHKQFAAELLEKSGAPRSGDIPVADHDCCGAAHFMDEAEAQLIGRFALL